MVAARTEQHERAVKLKRRRAAKLTSKESFRALLEPELATVVLVALFLNLLHQMGGVFISLYGLAVGMSLTQIGIIRAAYAGCNAVTRPISGHVVNKFGHRGLSYFGLPLQSAILMLIPLFTGFGTILFVYVARDSYAPSSSSPTRSDWCRMCRNRACGAVLPPAFIMPPAISAIFLGRSIGGLIAHATGIASVFVVGSLGSTALFFVGVFLLRRFKRTQGEGSLVSGA